jgi:truncated hemoglobin YjbI
MTSLYERVGGAATVTRLVDEFYARVLVDPDLAPTFAHTPMTTLTRMQREYFTAALGGPETYSGLSLREAHHGHHVTERQYARFAEHLLDTLRGVITDPDDVDAVMTRLTQHAEDVVGGATVDG